MITVCHLVFNAPVCVLNIFKRKNKDVESEKPVQGRKENSKEFMEGSTPTDRDWETLNDTQ